MVSGSLGSLLGGVLFEKLGNVDANGEFSQIYLLAHALVVPEQEMGWLSMVAIHINIIFREREREEEREARLDRWISLNWTELNWLLNLIGVILFHFMHSIYWRYVSCLLVYSFSGSHSWHGYLATIKPNAGRKMISFLSKTPSYFSEFHGCCFSPAVDTEAVNLLGAFLSAFFFYDLFQRTKQFIAAPDTRSSLVQKPWKKGGSNDN